MNKINLLAIDAQDEVCSVGLQFYDYKTDNIYTLSKIIRDRSTQAAVLLKTIEDLLSEHELELVDLDALVLSIGPGKFTGLRISASVIQGLAYSLNKDIITINSLLLYAEQFANIYLRTHQIPDFNNNLKPIWVCMKAYNNHYYQAKFILDNNVLYGLNNYSSASKKDSEFQNTDNNSDYIKTHDDIIEELKKEQDYHLVGCGWNEIIEPGHDANSIYSEPVDVVNIFSLANREYEDNNLQSPFDVLPVYGINPYKKT